MNFRDFEQRPSGLWVRRSDDKLKVGGIFHAKLIRDGELIDEWSEHNLVVNQGLDDILSAYFCQGSQTANWYMAPFKGNYSPVASDTAVSISSNATEATEYTSSTRVPYTPTEGSQSTTNANTPANFTFNASITVYGAMIISSSGKQSGSGVLFAATQFASPKNVVASDQLLLTYILSAASSS